MPRHCLCSGFSVCLSPCHCLSLSLGPCCTRLGSSASHILVLGVAFLFSLSAHTYTDMPLLTACYLRLKMRW